MDEQLIAARVKALLAKTPENDCTEAEAMLAASKAPELLDRYQIDRDPKDGSRAACRQY